MREIARENADAQLEAEFDPENGVATVFERPPRVQGVRAPPARSTRWSVAEEDGDEAGAASPRRDGRGAHER